MWEAVVVPRMTLREAFDQARADTTSEQEFYDRVFELMQGRLPSADEREMCKRRCLIYERELTGCMH